jgi:protocatechuate 3,4-dioxygenase alpha subunit
MRTPSQTVGPYFTLGLCNRPQSTLPNGTVEVHGVVFDGQGTPVADALVEVWDPDIGFGRAGTDAAGEFRFLVPAGVRRLEVMVFSRGLLKPVLTRMYAPGEGGAEDPTMIAVQNGSSLRFDVHLQGERETAFFEL